MAKEEQIDKGREEHRPVYLVVLQIPSFLPSAAYTMLTFCWNDGILGQMVNKYGECSTTSRFVQDILMPRGGSLLPEAG